MKNCPPTGWTTKARVVNVVDGDTIDVEVRRTMRIRLLDCWAPETHTRNLEEKLRGVAAMNAMRAMLPVNQEVTVHIPTNDHQDIAHVMTLGRVLGRIYVGEVDVSQEMVEHGHATISKHSLP